MDSVATSSRAEAPEIGQPVEVRGREWVVTDSIGSALPPDVSPRSMLGSERSDKRRWV